MPAKGVKDSSNPTMSALQGNELFPGIQSNSDKNATPLLIKDFLKTNTDFLKAISDQINSTLVQGSNITLTYNSTTGKLTIDAASSGGSGTTIPRHPGYRSNYFYRQGRYNANGGGITTGLTATPLILDSNVTITGLQIRITTGSAGTNLKAGIYNNSGGYPSTLVSGSEVVFPTANSSTAPVQLFSNPIAFTAGIYWIATIPDTAGASALVLGPADAQANTMVGSDNSTASVQNFISLYTSSFSYPSNLPTTFPASVPVSSVSPPLLWFKVQ